MFSTLKTLIDGAGARAENRLKDTYAVELIEQRIREAEANLSAAKVTLASLIQRKRSEDRLARALETRIADMSKRAREALSADRPDLAEEAAAAIAEMENEHKARQDSVASLQARISRLQVSVEAAHRRIVDLKQGLITARAVRHEYRSQARLNRTLTGGSAADEAEALIKRVVDQDDPFEQSEILRDIERGLDGRAAVRRLEDAGFGDATRSTAASVLERLKSEP